MTWFIVRVPVLSELIAEVEPRVSTESRLFTTAPWSASFVEPLDRITCRTVGMAMGTAARARAMAVVKMTSGDSPREIPRANMMAMVRPAAPAIHNVSVSSCAVSGVFRLGVDFSIPEILPTSVSTPVPVTIMTPLPCVTGEFMKAMSAWSPRAGSLPEMTSALFDAGTLSPVSPDSSISREAAWMIRPSAQTSSPAESRTTSPTTTLSASTLTSVPSRRTRADDLSIDCKAFMALSALPRWRIPPTAFTAVMARTAMPVVNSPIRIEAMAAATRMICM